MVPGHPAGIQRHANGLGAAVVNGVDNVLGDIDGLDNGRKEGAGRLHTVEEWGAELAERN